MTEDDPQELWEETQNRYPMLKRDREEVLDTQEQKHRRYWILGTLDTEAPMMHALWRRKKTFFRPLRSCGTPRRGHKIGIRYSKGT